MGTCFLSSIVVFVCCSLGLCLKLLCNSRCACLSAILSHTVSSNIGFGVSGVLFCIFGLPAVLIYFVKPTGLELEEGIFTVFVIPLYAIFLKNYLYTDYKSLPSAHLLLYDTFSSKSNVATEQESKHLSKVIHGIEFPSSKTHIIWDNLNFMLMALFICFSPWCSLIYRVGKHEPAVGSPESAWFILFTNELMCIVLVLFIRRIIYASYLTKINGLKEELEMIDNEPLPAWSAKLIGPTQRYSDLLKLSSPIGSLLLASAVFSLGTFAASKLFLFSLKCLTIFNYMLIMFISHNQLSRASFRALASIFIVCGWTQCCCCECSLATHKI